MVRALKINMHNNNKDIPFVRKISSRRRTRAPFVNFFKGLQHTCDLFKLFHRTCSPFLLYRAYVLTCMRSSFTGSPLSINYQLTQCLLMIVTFQKAMLIIYRIFFPSLLYICPVQITEFHFYPTFFHISFRLLSDVKHIHPTSFTKCAS